MSHGANESGPPIYAIFGQTCIKSGASRDITPPTIIYRASTKGSHAVFASLGQLSTMIYANCMQATRDPYFAHQKEVQFSFSLSTHNFFSKKNKR